MSVLAACAEGVLAGCAVVIGVVGFFLPDAPSWVNWTILGLGVLVGAGAASLGWDILRMSRCNHERV